jgi:type II secretory ATPase GspE/PulE/Tfp pilus assembly ATPase PilB-like protein
MSDLSLPPLTLVPLEDEIKAVAGASVGSGGGAAASRSEPFAWPTPPLAAYPSPTCQVEPQPCVVEGRGGNFVSGLLTVFEPQGVARVQVAGEKLALPLRFEQIRRLTLKRPLRALSGQRAAEGELQAAQAAVLTHHPAQPYEVKLPGGTAFSGRTVSHVELECGLFLFEPCDEQGSVERHFIPRVMIESHSIGERLGTLLAGEDGQRARDVEQGLEAQRRLRQQKLGDILVARQVVTRDQLLQALDKQARMPLVRLGEALVALGYVDEQQLEQSLRQLEVDRHRPLGEVLVQRGLVNLEEVRVALARKMGFPVVNVSNFPVEPEALRLLPCDLARRLKVLPLLRRGGRLVVAMEDATREDLLKTVQDVAQCAVLPALAGSGELDVAIERAYHPPKELAAPRAPMAAEPPLFTSELPDLQTLSYEPLPAGQQSLPPASLGDIDLPVLYPELEAGASAAAITPFPTLAPSAPAPALTAALAQAQAQRVVEAAASSSAVVQAAAASELRGRARLERSDSPVVQALVQLVGQALTQGARALHIQCGSEDEPMQVRLRQGDRLLPLPDLPASLRRVLLPRIKALAELDVLQTSRPQQGRIDFGRLSAAHPVELKVTTLPTRAGREDLVLGLPVQLRPMKLDGIGLNPVDLERYTGLLARPAGLILQVTPPQGGRTTTLHALIAHLNGPQRSIWSIEDRIQLTQPGLRQMEVDRHADAQAGTTVEEALRAVTQADADVIVVSDLRDAAGARRALDAALDGRLVIAAMPGRNATDAIQRLLDQGIDAWMLSEALIGVHAQRLVQRLCSACRMSRPAKEAEVEEWLNAHLGASGHDPTGEEREALQRSWVERWGREGRLRRYQSPGCERCDSTGSRRRTAVHELLGVGKEMRRLMRAGAPAWNLQRQAVKDGMKTLRQDAIEKMLAGLVSQDEVRRVGADI